MTSRVWLSILICFMVKLFCVWLLIRSQKGKKLRKKMVNVMYHPVVIEAVIETFAQAVFLQFE